MSRPAYVSTGELDTFHFHDACLEGIKKVDQGLVWTVSALNVTQSNSLNPDGPDQCVDATILFEDGKIAELIFPAYVHSTSKAKGVLVSERKVPPQQFDEVLGTLLSKPCYILELEELNKTSDGYSARFFLSGSPYCLVITVRFRSVTVTWDAFQGPAWYVNWPPM